MARYVQLEIACRAFIFFQGEILLCKQKNPSRNFWALPGGSVKEGETLAACITRELSEETGMVFEAEKLLYVRELITSSRHRIEFYFSIKEPKSQNFYKKIKPHNEIEDLHFFKIEDLKSVIFKPNCLLDLILEMKEQSSMFPRYLGNIS